jgi:hypothetical protein
MRSDAADSDSNDRQLLIEELERGVASRRRAGVFPVVALVGFVCSAFLFWSMSEDFAYFFSSKIPIELGAEGDYHFDRALSGRHASIRGIPSARGWYTEEKAGSFVVMGLNDTPLLFKRSIFPDEASSGTSGKRPQPRQNPVSVRGRLLSRANAGPYEEAFLQYETWAGVPAHWLLIVGESPGRDLSAVAASAAIAAFGLLNAWLFFVGFRRRS